MRMKTPFAPVRGNGTELDIYRRFGRAYDDLERVIKDCLGDSSAPFRIEIVWGPPKMK